MGTDKIVRIDRYLDTIGDGTGVIIANLDGSVTPFRHDIDPPIIGQYIITRMIITIRDNGVFRPDHYGTLPELTNGIIVGLFDGDDLVEDFTDGNPVKNNAEWGSLCYDVDVKEWGAGGGGSDELLFARWSFDKAGRTIRMAAGDPVLGVKIQDDLTGLVDHRFMVQGQWRLPRTP